MKILHITPSLAAGGAERMINKIVKNDKDNEHIIVSLLDLPIHYDFSDVKIIDLKYDNNLSTKILSIFELIKIVKKEKPDIVQTWMKTNYYGPIIKIFTGAKIISNFRNGYVNKLNKINIILHNIYFKFFNANIFVSESALKERINSGFRFQKTFVVNNGFSIPSDEFKKNHSSDNFIIGHLARFHPVKNQQLIIDSFTEFLKDRNSVLVMGGRDIEENLNYSSTIEPYIEFKGNIKNIDQFYSNIDVFILTSHSEGFPNVVGEAMSYGVPVIATDAGETYTIIGETGFKVKNKDDIISTLETLYLNRDILVLKGEKAKQRIKELYNIESAILKYIKIYQEVGNKNENFSNR